MILEPVMVNSHDHRLVALSVVISVVAAYAAHELSERIGDTHGRAWLAWLVGGATANGIATCSMHYTGMLAFQLPVPVRYDWRTALLSLLVAITGSGAAFFVASRNKAGWPRALAASIFMGGVGISGTHYIGMAAMRVQGIQHHSHALMSLSIALAIMICFAALALAYLFSDDAPGRNLRHHGWC